MLGNFGWVNSAPKMLSSMVRVRGTMSVRILFMMVFCRCLLSPNCLSVELNFRRDLTLGGHVLRTKRPFLEAPELSTASKCRIQTLFSVRREVRSETRERERERERVGLEARSRRKGNESTNCETLFGDCESGTSLLADFSSSLFNALQKYPHSKKRTSLFCIFVTN